MPCKLTCRVQNPNIRITGASVRGGALRGGALRGRTVRTGRTRCRRVGSPRRHLSLLRSRVSKTNVLNVYPGVRANEFKCKPMEEQSERMMSGLSGREEARSLFLAVDQWTDAFLSSLRGRGRSSTQSSAPKIEDGFFLCFRAEDRR